MVLIDIPMTWKTMAVIRMETGIAVSEMTVVLTLRRKTKRMTATTAMASTSTFKTLSMEVWMKVACRKST